MQIQGKFEHAIVKALVYKLAAAGFVPVKVWDGGEYVEARTADEVIDAAFSVDEATIHFAPQGAPEKWGRFGVFVVPGNGADIISDFHCGNPTFTAAIEAVSAGLDGAIVEVRI